MKRYLVKQEGTAQVYRHFVVEIPDDLNPQDLLSTGQIDEIANTYGVDWLVYDCDEVTDEEVVEYDPKFHGHHPEFGWEEIKDDIEEKS